MDALCLTHTLTHPSTSQSALSVLIYSLVKVKQSATHNNTQI